MASFARKNTSIRQTEQAGEKGQGLQEGIPFQALRLACLDAYLFFQTNPIKDKLSPPKSLYST